MNVGTLTIELAANMARLSRDLSAAQKSVEGTMAQIRASAEAAMSALGRIGVGLSFAGLSAFVKTAIDAADEMNKLSQRIGVAVEDLAGMQLAFRQGGVDAEKFSTSMAKLAAGIADGKESLAAMGIETRKADGSFKSTRQIIVEVANKFATYRDGVEKTALAIDLFGRSGAELIPTLNAGGASLDEFDKIARKLGLTLDKETTEAAERFNDKMELIGLASRGLANQVMSELLPTLEALADHLLDAKMKGDGLANTAKMIAAPIRVIIETISVLAVEAVYMFKAIRNEIGGIMAQISLGPAALHPLSKEAEAFKRIREMMIADGEAARKEYEAAIARILNAGKDLTAQAEKAAAASNSISRGAAPQMAKALKDLDAAFESQRITATAWAKAMQDAQSRLDKAAAQTDGLSDSQAALREYLRDNYAQVQKINPEMNVMVVNLYKAAIATEQAKDATDKYKKLLAGAEEASKKYTDALQKNVDTVQEQIKDLQKEEEAIKIAKDSRISLAEAIQQVEIARLREKQAIESETGAGEQNIEIIEREIAAREKLAELLASKEAREANARAAKEAADQWKSVTMDIERALTDALVRGFENGKSFFKSLGNYLVNFFKTTLARAIAQSIMTGVGLGTSGLAGASFGGGGGTEPGSLGNILGLGNIVSTLSNVYNTVIGGFTNLGNTVAFAAQDIGAWLVTNTSGVLNSAGSTLMSTAMTLGTVASYVGGMAAGLGLGRMISGRFEAFGNGNIATVGGTIIGAIIGGPIGAAIGGAIGGLINRAFGMGPEQVTGAAITGTFGSAGANVSQVTNTFQEGGWFRSDRRRQYEEAISAELQVLLDTALRATADVVARYATVLGLPVDAIAGFTQAINIDIKDKTPEEIEKAIADALSGFGDAMITSLFPEITQFIRANETAGEAFMRLANHLVGVNQVLGTLNLQLMDVSLAGADAASSLIALFGGEENFLNATNEFYQMFYSEAERTAKLTEQLQQAFAALGVEMPNTREQFRAIVESLDLTTESGRRTFAALMTLAPSFNSIADAAEQAAEIQARATQEMLSAAGINAAALSDIIRDGLLGRLSQEDVGAKVTEMIVGGVYNALASTYAAQITQLMMDGIITPMVTAAATGASVSAAVSQQSIDVMIAQVNAVTAAFAEILKNPTLLEAIRSLGETISAALGGIGSTGQIYIPPPVDFGGGMRQPESADKWIAEREQLERRLLTLQGNTVELRRRELEALDPVNRALQQQIWALEDQQRIQQERLGLETQLLTLQGDTAELRRRELEALDPSNRALQEQIWALEDAKKANEEYNNSLRGITSSLDAEVNRIRGLFYDKDSASLAALQSEFAIATASARAGDLSAAEKLPGLAQKMLEVGAAQANSMLDVLRLRAATAASLSETSSIVAAMERGDIEEALSGLPVENLPTPQPSVISPVNPSTRPFFQANTQAQQEIKTELQNLREDARAQWATTVQLQTRLTRIVERWDGDGLPMERVEA